jgi:hypothetical protein
MHALGRDAGYVLQHLSELTPQEVGTLRDNVSGLFRVFHDFHKGRRQAVGGGERLGHFGRSRMSHIANLFALLIR